LEAFGRTLVIGGVFGCPQVQGTDD
jgi:hypothetical protein